MSRPVDLLIGCCVLVEGADWLFRFLVRLEQEKKGNTVAKNVMLISWAKLTAAVALLIL